MKIKFCLPVIKKSQKEVLKSLKIKGFDYYEIWLDYIKDLDEGFIIDLAKKFRGKIIFVFRRQNLEPIKLSYEKRKKIISLLLKLPVFLDLDFLTQHEELEFLKMSSARIKLILSYHNYKETPDLAFLENLINKMKRYSPEIYKMATFCKEEMDALKLLNIILKLQKQDLKYIILGMGDKGQITRIIGSIWGNEINFTPLFKKARSAKGQLTKKGLELILKEIY